MSELLNITKKYFEDYKDLRIEDSITHNPTIIANVFVGEIKFEFPGVTFPIMLRIWQNVRTDSYIYELSHHVKTPLMSTSYSAGNPTGKSLDELMFTAMSQDFLEEFDKAVKAGYQPEDNWFIANRFFKSL
ncbi:hypothetical protein ACQV5M_15205 [Leptospira sp. SA-E8]|uniref:hypothetical protein n=1 Tax=Leptospira sp. SA-E8 TaxID=3422259 RepID=UPI003EC0D916